MLFRSFPSHDTDVNEGGVIKYSLEEYMELENDLLNSKPAAKVVEEPIAEELNFTMKVETEKPQAVNYFDEVSPVEMTIEETLKHRADERRRKLKEFNYKFHNNPSRIEELEKEPAYKRLDATHTKLEEAGTMNVFFRINDTLYTAPTSERILDGVTRKSLIELAKREGINVEVRSILVDELVAAAKDVRM